jgi:hypothetical protein
MIDKECDAMIIMMARRRKMRVVIRNDKDELESQHLLKNRAAPSLVETRHLF